MNKMTDKDVGWVTGIIEGEGCITVPSIGTHHSKKVTPDISVVMTDEDTITRLHKTTGLGNIRCRKTAPNRKDVFVWSVTKRLDILALLCEIIDDLSSRRTVRGLEILDKINMLDEIALVKKELGVHKYGRRPQARA